MLITDRARYAGSRFADQFQIAQGGIVGERVGDERGLIHFGGIGRIFSPNSIISVT